MKFLRLNDIVCHKRALSLSNYVWNIVILWDWFAKCTVGTQIVTACDSISANIAEGFGRYGKKDKIKFYFYSQGSIKEGHDWNEKAKHRGLIKIEQYEYILKELTVLPRETYQLIQFTNERLKI